MRSAQAVSASRRRRPGEKASQLRREASTALRKEFTQKGEKGGGGGGDSRRKVGPSGGSCRALRIERPKKADGEDSSFLPPWRQL